MAGESKNLRENRFHNPETNRIIFGANPCNFGIIENHWKTEFKKYPDFTKYLDIIRGSGYRATDVGDEGFMPQKLIADPKIKDFKVRLMDF